MLPFLKELRKLYFDGFKGMPQKCPMDPGKYYVQNFTIGGTYGDEMNTKLSTTPLPNGVYRHVIRIFTDNDPEGFVLYWHTEVNIRMNIEKF